MGESSNWKDEWKGLFENEHCFAAFYLWAEQVKGETEFDIDSDLAEQLMEEYSNDPEIGKMMQESFKAMGIEGIESVEVAGWMQP